jgi:hypothetical protein
MMNKIMYSDYQNSDNIVYRIYIDGNISYDKYIYMYNNDLLWLFNISYHVGARDDSNYR